MNKLLPSLSIAVLLLLAHIAPAPAATLRMIDQSTLHGDLIALNGKILTLNGAAATQPTTRMSIDMSDITQVVFREPPPPKPPTPPPTQQNSDDDNSGGFLKMLFGGSSSPRPPAPAPVTPRPTTSPASRPAPSIRWLMKLKTGDAIHGHISQWSDQQITIHPDASSNQPLSIANNQLLELWCGSDASRQKAAAIKIDPSPQDTAFVEKDGNVVSVKGLALGITGDSLRFRLDDNERKISLARLVGIIFASANFTPQSDFFHQAVHLDTGDIITGTWTAIDPKSVSIATAGGITLHIPISTIYTIDFLNGRLVYLSDLKPAGVEQTPFFGRVIPFRLDRSLEGGPLQLSDGVYSKGIAVHSRCVLQYDIHGNFARFQTKFGFEDPAGKTGRVSAHILGDGKILFENPDARGDQKPIDIDLDITHLQTLTLKVDFGKGQDVAARVIWANARLLRAKASP